MFDTTTPFVLLEDRLDTTTPARLYRRPVEVLDCRRAHHLPGLLKRVERARRDGLHAAGYFAYELAYALEPRLSQLTPHDTAKPLAWFGLFEPPERPAARDLDALLGRLPPPPPITAVRFGHSRGEHVAKVEEILRLIAAGDLYQANLTFPIDFQYDGAPASLYAAMRSRQPVHHGALLWTGEHWLLSVSPELFFETQADVVTTRPMKGTCPRGEDTPSDRRSAARLSGDPKQRAENLMIVDLLRNDVSRVAVPGSVQVPKLFAVETYPSFHAMTSTVTGRLAPEAGLSELLSALFPCGSVVGAPKIRAAEVISHLEAEPRGAYCGAIGALEPNGAMRFAVAIRTASLDPHGAGRYGVGGGIVADSRPTEEYDEALLKGRVLTDLARDHHLIETLRWDPAAGFQRLEGHLARLARSAAALDVAYDAADLAIRLNAAVSALSHPARVRAALHRDGRLEVTTGPLDAAGEGPLDVRLSAEILDSADPFLRHKTSRRDQHERAFVAAIACGGHEAILLNTRGEIADGARSSVFLQVDGLLLTPPVRCGALPGVLRQDLIARGQAVEAVLTPDDLRGRSLFLGSSLRGLRAAMLIEETCDADRPTPDVRRPSAITS